MRHEKCSNFKPFKVEKYFIAWIPKYRKKFVKRSGNIWVGGFKELGREKEHEEPLTPLRRFWVCLRRKRRGRPLKLGKILRQPGQKAY